MCGLLLLLLLLLGLSVGSCVPVDTPNFVAVACIFVVVVLSVESVFVDRFVERSERVQTGVVVFPHSMVF